MKRVRMCGLLILAAAALLAFASTASATQLTGAGGNVLGPGTFIHTEAEETLTMHPPTGEITCKKMTLGGSVSNAGGASATVGLSVQSLTFDECNATVHVLSKGSLEIHTGTGANNGTLTSTGLRLTTLKDGFHCIFETNGTDLGTVTGSANTGGAATLDIEATIPRTGGKSGFFCGQTAQWTGSIRFNSPNPLNIH